MDEPGPGAGDTLQCAIAYNEHGGYCVPTSALQRPAARMIVGGEVYEPDTIRFMMERCGDRDIVHAGTFFGDFLPALAHAAAGDAIIWAFEPSRENYRCARITIELNGIENVRLSNAGLGEASGRAEVMTVDPRGRAMGGASRIVTGPSTGTTEPVDVVALDDVIPDDRDVGLLQLDVEDYEQQALAGALAIIRRCRPIIILEQRPGSGLFEGEWFRAEVLDLGYQRHSRLHGNWVFVPR